MSKEQDLKLAEQYFEEGEALDKEAKYEEAIKVYEQASILYEKWKLWAKWVKANNKIGWNYYCLGDYNRGVKHLQVILKNGEKQLGSDHTDIGGCLNNLGVCYYAKGDYELAINCHKKVLTIYIKGLGKEDINVSVSLNNLGVCYFYKGDYELAINYFKKALAIDKQNMGKEHPNPAANLNNLSSCYHAKGDYDLAIKFNKEALTMYKKSLGKEHPLVADCLDNQGGCYWSKGDYALAINYHQKALAIYEKNLGKEHPDVAFSLSNLGSCYYLKGDYALAINYHQKALAIYEKSLGKEHPDVALNLNKLGTCYYSKGDNDLAISYHQNALIALVPFFQQESIYENPTLTSYSSGYDLLDALNGKSVAFFNTYVTLQNKHVKDLQAALSTIQLATELVSHIRQSYKTEGSKHTLAKEAAKTYNQAIKIALKTAKVYQTLPSIPQHPEFTNIPYTPQGCKNLAFDFSEQSKAILLLSSLKDSEAKATANIPKDLLQQEKQLKIELNYLDKSIATQEAKGDQKDEELLSKFQRQYFDYKQQYDQLIEQFEADYPEYYRLKYAVETASVGEIQRYLQTQTSPLPPSKGEFSTLISYHIAEEKVYIFTITSNDYQIHTLDKPSNFPQLISDFQDAIALADIDEYMDSASILFDLLLRPVLEDLQNTSKLILIPHNELTTLSFDALIDTRKLNAESRAKISTDCDFSALPYLVKDYDISYHYSATMLLHSVAQQEQKPPQAASFLGFAPVNFDGSENTELALASSRGQTKVMRSNRAGEAALSKLPNTENEVKEVFQLFEAKELDAQAFLYASANKENLFENAMNHKYVLIATHGYAQDGNAGLSGIYLARGQATDDRSVEVSDTYSNYLLHTSEAYHLQLNADLVVLSSCSSGVGKLVTGEGMMAINRGFLYAGASNIIFTQFDIPDASSGELVRRLFECVLEGESYASALRKAKLKLIKQKMKTPEDWAGYALIGG